MDDIKAKITEIKASGDKYFIYFATIFSFIFFVVIIPLKKPEDSSLGSVKRSINARLLALDSMALPPKKWRKQESIHTTDKQTSAKHTKAAERNELNPKTTSKSTITVITKSEQSRFKAQKASHPDSLTTDTAMIHRNEKKLILEEKRTALYKELYALTELSNKKVDIPILNISMEATTVAALFLGFIVGNLSLILYYRDRFFVAYCSLPKDQREDSSIPFWAAPIPLTLKAKPSTNTKTSEWVSKNTLGILAHCIAIYVGIDTTIHYLPDTGPEINAVNTIILVTALITYIITLVRFFKLEWQRTIQ